MSEQVQQWIAILSLVVPVAAFLWEFAVIGRKRLGYRVQMDTLAADAADKPYAGVLGDMEHDGHRLKDPSFVLLRIENAGSARILCEDYLADPADPYGIKVTFRGRRVAAVVLTDPSEQEVPDFFFEEVEGEDNTIRIAAKPGFRRSNNEAERTGIVRLPKVTLPRGAEYKVLMVLERWPDDDSTGEFPEPVVSGVGGQGHWYDTVLKFFRLKATKTESHVFASRPAWWVIWLLVAGVGVQACFTLFLPDERRPPMDCAHEGTLHLHGSTAFGHAAQAAAEDYLKRCRGANVSIPKGTFKGSGTGVNALDRAGREAGIEVGEGLGDHIAFTDGLASDGHPRLIPTPVALSVFTLVVNEKAGVENLTLAQVREVFAGRVRNWSEVNGNDEPVHLINREPGSGTRGTLVAKLLNDRQPPQFTVPDCASLKSDRYGNCEVQETATVLDEVASRDGAIGYSEATKVDGHEDADRLVKLRIDGREPTAEGVEEAGYPYWQTEFAYTYGEAPAGSIAASFLNYLTQQSGRDILREHGHALCSEVGNSGECRPA
ncbi:substrate-binding domain-containing protein [Streptomyces somaliensis DSM 40738]|uniref:PBP domain-containing protein n=1 Tax=Streptomyces somaliensis (strain ATCC 33201 / DSM 40738 / JCM 12659 / KCTC 9044 / NCTC 11332 / NRRL B-12077 / IP 733) TaxID=1134445 RepID=A0AA44IDV6_STRE0|nr:substrate-binding domain-containing protein [Streptomyces somaliensis]MCQ0025276.1 substrate-binding domain-containing protein [Streptomyces somaliensis DSM 40738]NKY14678.1 hypothetical protein [Streptomyces somaliensis DSM 40738]